MWCVRSFTFKSKPEQLNVNSPLLPVSAEPLETKSYLCYHHCVDIEKLSLLKVKCNWLSLSSTNSMLASCSKWSTEILGQPCSSMDHHYLLHEYAWNHLTALGSNQWPLFKISCGLLFTLSSKSLTLQPHLLYNICYRLRVRLNLSHTSCLTVKELVCGRHLNHAFWCRQIKNNSDPWNAV